MAHIKVNKKELDDLIGKPVKDTTLEEQASYLGAHWNKVKGPKWDVEVYPDRPDLLSVEGLARAYRAFFDVETGLKQYEVMEAEIEVEKDESVNSVRPHIAAGVVRNVELDERTINGLVQLQEKLHETLGRQRDKLAIGLHDLSQLEPPFEYRAVRPERVSFTPLEEEEEMDLGEILSVHEKGEEYSWILEEEDRYPVIEDSKGQVLSFPPIINNQLTEVTPDTADIFIDVTGKDKQTVRKALNIISTALAERGGMIEAVKVDGVRLPDLSPQEMKLDPNYAREVSGLKLGDSKIVELLEKMGHSAEEKGSKLKVEVPAYRTDVMHQYDLIEEVVVAHGYNNVEPEMPEVDQIGGEKKVEEFSKVVREAMIGAGVLETHTFVLSSKEKLFDKMEMEEQPHASMSNALTEDYEVVRNWMLPSLMEALKDNRHHQYPQEFFEIGEVVEMPGAENAKKLCLVTAGNVDYNDARQKLQVVENALGIELDLEAKAYEFSDPNRSAQIKIDGEEAGFIAELDQQVIDNWGLETDVSCFEIDVEKLMQAYY